MGGEEVDAIGELLAVLNEAAPLSRPLLGGRHERVVAYVITALQRARLTPGGGVGNIVPSLSRGLHILLPLLLLREASRQVE